MILAHKIRLDPTNVQRTYFLRACGIARFAYNWGLIEWGKQYDAWKKNTSLDRPSEPALRRRLNAIKRDQFPWMMEVTKCAPEMAIMHLGGAYQSFLAGRSGYPKLKRKGIRDRFSASSSNIKFVGKRVWIPKLGWVRMREVLRFQGKILSVTVSRVADTWFISVPVEVEKRPRAATETQGAVGVDLGLKAMATLSTGEVITGPKPHKAMLQRIRRLSRSLSRKIKGSANRAKARVKLARLYARIAAIRLDAIHKLTSQLTRTFHIIGIEDLNVRGMLRNHRLARSIADMGFYEFRTQLSYKTELTGGLLVLADRFFPSTKTCSTCGHRISVLPLSKRQWICPECTSVHDRDLNAAINLRVYAVSSTVSACGE